jgi:hypothetical protein
MAQDRGKPVAPPADLASRKLVLRILPKGLRGWRIHVASLGPCHFSKDPAGRFSSPSLPVLYLADADTTSLWEVYWDDLATRPPDQRRIAGAKLDQRAVCRVTLQRDVPVFDATDGKSLRTVSAPTATFSGAYEVCQVWAAALFAHPRRPEGIHYRSARSASGACTALFAPRVACSDLRFGTSRRITQSKALLLELERNDVKILADP